MSTALGGSRSDSLKIEPEELSGSQAAREVMSRRETMLLIPDLEITKNGQISGAHPDVSDDDSYDSENEEYLYALEKKDKTPPTTGLRYKVIIAIAFLIILALIIVVAWQHFSFRAEKVCTTPGCVKTSAYILGKMNQSVDPCTDFYAYSCGGWLKTTDIPPTKAKYGSFAEIATKNKAIIKKLLDQPGNMYQGKNSSSVQKVKDYYKMCMDVEKINNEGNKPMLKLIKMLGSWTVTSDSISGTWNESSWNFMNALVKTHKLSMLPLFFMTVGTDDKHSDQNVISFGQSGLSLAEREEYFNSNSAKFKKALIEYGSKLGELLGGKNSVQQKMTDIYDFEKRLAEIMVSKENLTDPWDRYNKMTLKEFQEIVGNEINMQDYLEAMFNDSVTMDEQVLVSTPDYFMRLGNLLKSTSRETLANYIVWHIVQFLSGYLPAEFGQAVLILTRVQSGINAIPQRWESCMIKTSIAMPFVTGALYVHEKFPPDSKTEVLQVIKDIKNSFKNNLLTVGWMDEETRNFAVEKVKAVTDMIGYPDYILDPVKLDEHYENLTLVDGEFFFSKVQVLKFQKNLNLMKRGKKPDHTLWDMGPAAVNAYYNPSNNQIVFPAGLLQKPFYSPNFPLAFRYGSLGSIVGHELTHGFDNKGRNYDKFGNLHKWWTNKSELEFLKQSDCIVDEYDSFTVKGTHLNGEFTLAENIADNGGVKTAFSAYKLVEKTADEPVQLPGLDLTPDQSFFVGFAQIWCSYYTPQYAQQVVLTDVHAYAKYRVIGTMTNSKDFSKAYKCPAKSPMNRERKCAVW